MEASEEAPATGQGLDQHLATHGAALAAHEEGIRALQASHQVLHAQQGQIMSQLRADSLRDLAESFRTLTLATTPPPVAQAPPINPPLPPDAKEPKLQLPLRYGGEPGKCRGFLTQCIIFFKAQAPRFYTQEARVAFILSLLTGTALEWADHLIRASSPVMSHTDRLMAKMTSVFDHDVSAQEAAMRLTRLRQGTETVASFSIRFRALAGETGWADGPLSSLFLNALSDSVKDALSVLKVPATFGALVSTAIRVDNRIRERERERAKGGNRDRPPRHLPPPALPPSAYPSFSREEPMQVDGAAVCNPRGTRPQEGSIPYHSGTLLAYPPQPSHQLGGDEAVIRQWGPRCGPHCSVPRFLAVGGSGANVESSTDCIQEQDSSCPDWNNSLVSSEGCEESLAWDSLADGSLMWEEPPTDSEIEWPASLDSFPDKESTKVGGVIVFSLPPNVPEQYRFLAEVFSRQRATTLRPHRPYDCAIELYPGTVPPRGSLYSLSIPESVAMKAYIEASLTNGFIRPSTSPAGAGFFFVKKKTGGFVHVLTIGALMTSQ
ncbi:hypothetical protein SKAU_G00415390 [Synaphobranchus kaupii]|uniref:DUF4939 domain-containing protein n=1 Tax=Synaphobranchus kaupii TaxID=118154 RepID=A0A9Q1E7B9_SYNKA|nr:hypothetical protein SKAU_G00415390 [Synaphobranchus kaupii]